MCVWEAKLQSILNYPRAVYLGYRLTKPLRQEKTSWFTCRHSLSTENDYRFARPWSLGLHSQPLIFTGPPVYGKLWKPFLWDDIQNTTTTKQNWDNTKWANRPLIKKIGRTRQNNFRHEDKWGALRFMSDLRNSYTKAYFITFNMHGTL